MILILVKKNKVNQGIEERIKKIKKKKKKIIILIMIIKSKMKMMEKEIKIQSIY